MGGVPEHFNLPWRLVLEQGRIREAGLKLWYEDYPGGTGALTYALQTGELDMAVVLTEGIVASIVKGNPVRLVKVYVTSPLIWGVHVPAQSELHELKQIIHYPYAISRHGSGSHLMAIVHAVQMGWSSDQLNFKKVGGLEGARKALRQGQAQVFFWERFMTQPYVDKGEFRRIAEVHTPWPCFVVAVREDVLAERADDVYHILDIINAQCQQLMDDPEAAAVISTRYDLKEEDVREWLRLTRWSTDFDYPKRALYEVQEALLSAGVIEAGLALDELWHYR